MNTSLRIAAIAVLTIATAAGMAEARGLKVLHAFKGGKDGGEPESGLVADGQGNFYGTTRQGGKGECHDFFGNVAGCGTVFKITAAGKKVMLYTFKGKKDGGAPVGTLAVGADGSVYGATQSGGIFCPQQTDGCGTVFKIGPDGKQTTLHRFQAGTDGATPRAGVILGGDGNIYGTTYSGGSDNCTGGCGTVFKLTPSGEETILHRFDGGTDGLSPWGEMVFDDSGNLYGTTSSGGSSECTFSCGTLFKIKPNGTKVILHNFGADVEDGSDPMGGLTFDDKGTLWGTTLQGGDHVRGTLYKMTRNGKVSVAWAFGAFEDGAFPSSGVVFDGLGNLYGALPTDGSGGPGMIFKYSIADQTESIVYPFPPLPAGREPYGALALDANGNLYGTTDSGGPNHSPDCSANGCGEAFRLPLP
ncbi:MAG TPA: choice-of-anchor tandem repeat GloVer-containing protein [Rhizomicrobium sp.]|nr:choice-of-anchor tandem repeat GloVer-containing protein [Rhizomicrobium sp.]